jgi:hypothetical protein
VILWSLPATGNREIDDRNTNCKKGFDKSARRVHLSRMLTVLNLASHPTPTAEIGGWVASTRWRQIWSAFDVEVSEKSGQAARS